jgi:hypothetical protein
MARPMARWRSGRNLCSTGRWGGHSDDELATASQLPRSSRASSHRVGAPRQSTAAALRAEPPTLAGAGGSVERSQCFAPWSRHLLPARTPPRRSRSPRRAERVPPAETLSSQSTHLARKTVSRPMHARPPMDGTARQEGFSPNAPTANTSARAAGSIRR